MEKLFKEYTPKNSVLNTVYKYDFADSIKMILCYIKQAKKKTIELL